jgi:hypothetical protein
MHKVPRHRRHRAAAELRRYAFDIIVRGVAALIAALTCSLAMGVDITGWAFGEGFTSTAPGAPAEIYYRAFSLGNMPEICGSSGVPVKLVPRRDPIRLHIGDSIQRVGQVPGNKQTHVVVDAYDEHDHFLPHVPITVTVIDAQRITEVGTERDDLRAVSTGDANFEVTWACGPNDAPMVQTRIRMVVE